jgi:hypothetical protein
VEHPINVEQGFSDSRDYEFCNHRIVLLIDSNSPTENRSNHVNEKIAGLVGVYRASGFRCMPEAANGRTKEYRNDACFFSLYKRFSGKPLWPEIASTKVSTSSDCAHDLADKDAYAYANAHTCRTINWTIKNGKQKNDRREAGRRLVSFANTVVVAPRVNTPNYPRLKGGREFLDAGRSSTLGTCAPAARMHGHLESDRARGH